MRIVSLLPSATEILCAIGAGDDLVGVTHECDFPASVRSLPRVTSSALEHDGSSADIDRHVRASLHAGSSLYHLDSELLERLKPDLIVTQELCKVCAVDYAIVARAAKRLSTDPRIVSLEPSSLEDVYDTIAFLGEITAHQMGAQNVLADLRARTDRLEREVADALRDAGGRRPRTLVLEWTDPPMSGGHWTPGLLERAGGEALLANPGANSQVLNWDQIADADPDVVVVAPCGFDLAATRAAVDELVGVPAWRDLRAHRRNEVYLLDGNAYLNRPGPRLIDTAEMLATMLFEDTLDLPVLDPSAWEPLHA
jgi:iron complex transport system substrate-binding protein